MDNHRKPTPRRKKKSNLSGTLLILAVLFLFMATTVMVAATVKIFKGDGKSGAQNVSKLDDPSISETSGTQGTPFVPGISIPGLQNPSKPDDSKPPKKEVVSTASVGVTGDILMHGPVIEAAKAASEKRGEYDFTGMFQYVKPYYEQYDFMVANLECTLGGTAAGPYKGYPTFNCPDSIIDGLQYAGVDMMLTANNHSYDTGYDGFIRTQEVLNDKGMPHLGTQLSADDKDYIIQDINGIKVGMICYTYETRGNNPDRKYLNVIQLSEKAGPLVTSFHPDKLDAFYSELEQQLAEMEAAGAEVTMVYIHWGEEYYLSPNSTQKKMAQKLCDLGVDVIVGGHPHVVEPFTTLTSENGNTSYCIYSLGNALSNQNRTSLKNDTKNAKYTEDGMIFGVTFQKWSDGTVEVAEIEITPTWVEKKTVSDYNVYTIFPLDATLTSWTDYTAVNHDRLTESYNRTMSIVGEGLNLCREDLGLEAAAITVDGK